MFRVEFSNDMNNPDKSFTIFKLNFIIKSSFGANAISIPKDQ